MGGRPGGSGAADRQGTARRSCGLLPPLPARRVDGRPAVPGRGACAGWPVLARRGVRARAVPEPAAHATRGCDGQPAGPRLQHRADHTGSRHSVGAGADLRALGAVPVRRRLDVDGDALRPGSVPRRRCADQGHAQRDQPAHRPRHQRRRRTGHRRLHRPAGSRRPAHARCTAVHGRGGDRRTHGRRTVFRRGQAGPRWPLQRSLSEAGLVAGAPRLSPLRPAFHDGAQDALP